MLNWSSIACADYILLNMEGIEVNDHCIFKTEKGHPISFVISYGHERRTPNIRQLIEKHGGVVSRDSGPHTIELVPPNTLLLHNGEIFSTEYIKKCCEENTLLDLRKYRVNKHSSLPKDVNVMDIMLKKLSWTDIYNRCESRKDGVEISDIESDANNIPSVSGYGLKNRRTKYSEAERKTILNYVTKLDTRKVALKGNQVWKQMEKRKVCPGRNWHSLREHFIKKILPKLDSFQLSKEQLTKIKQGTTSTWSSSTQRSPSTNTNNTTKQCKESSSSSSSSSTATRRLHSQKRAFDADSDSECSRLSKPSTSAVKPGIHLFHNGNKKVHRQQGTLKPSSSKKQKDVIDSDSVDSDCSTVIPMHRFKQKKKASDKREDKLSHLSEKSKHKSEVVFDGSPGADIQNEAQIFDPQSEKDVNTEISSYDSLKYWFDKSDNIKQNITCSLENNVFLRSHDTRTERRNAGSSSSQSTIDTTLESRKITLSPLSRIAIYRKLDDPSFNEASKTKLSIQPENLNSSKSEEENDKSPSSALSSSSTDSTESSSRLPKTFGRTTTRKRNLSSTSSDDDQKKERRLRQRKKPTPSKVLKVEPPLTASHGGRGFRGLPSTCGKAVDKNKTSSDFDQKNANNSRKKINPQKSLEVKQRLSARHGGRGFRRNAKFYTIREDLKILNYLINSNSLSVVGGNKVWTDMEYSQLLPGRSWQSMKERFRKVIFKKIDKYNLSREDISLIKTTGKPPNTSVVKTKNLPVQTDSSSVLSSEDEKLAIQEKKKSRHRGLDSVLTVGPRTKHRPYTAKSNVYFTPSEMDDTRKQSQPPQYKRKFVWKNVANCKDPSVPGEICKNIIEKVSAAQLETSEKNDQIIVPVSDDSSHCRLPQNEDSNTYIMMPNEGGMTDMEIGDGASCDSFLPFDAGIHTSTPVISSTGRGKDNKYFEAESNLDLCIFTDNGSPEENENGDIIPLPSFLGLKDRLPEQELVIQDSNKESANPFPAVENTQQMPSYNESSVPQLHEISSSGATHFSEDVENRSKTEDNILVQCEDNTSVDIEKSDKSPDTKPENEINQSCQSQSQCVGASVFLTCPEELDMNSLSPKTDKNHEVIICESDGHQDSKTKGDDTSQEQLVASPDSVNPGLAKSAISSSEEGLFYTCSDEVDCSPCGQDCVSSSSTMIAADSGNIKKKSNTVSSLTRSPAKSSKQMEVNSMGTHLRSFSIRKRRPETRNNVRQGRLRIKTALPVKFKR